MSSHTGFADAALVHPTALLYGRVAIGEGASVWPYVVMRSETAHVRIGAYTNVQDFVMVHTSPNLPVEVGAYCSITHHATLHGCRIGDNCLVGIHATVYDGAQVGNNCIIGQHSYVKDGTVIPDNSVVVGSPAKVIRTRNSWIPNRLNALLYHRNAWPMPGATTGPGTGRSSNGSCRKRWSGCTGNSRILNGAIMRQLDVRVDTFPIRGAFTISRGSKTKAEVITVRLTEGDATGWAESVPYGRYGETTDSVLAQIEAIRAQLEAGCSRGEVGRLLPPGAARNAVDCALWDLEARLSGTPVWQLAGLREPVPVTTAYTLSLGAPEAMAEAARNAPGTDLLKLKLGGEADLDRLRAVREAVPKARLIVDANEGWDFETLERLAPQCAALGVVLIEQPLPAAQDHVLTRGRNPVRICADESCHTAADVARLADRYDAVNIKLDKTGGLTEAIHTLEQARSNDMDIMIGCMVGSSLAMAPAVLLTPYASFVDLDGPLLLSEDRTPSLCYQRGQIIPTRPGLWG